MICHFARFVAPSLCFLALTVPFIRAEESKGDLTEARKELFAAQYEHAAEQYRSLANAHPDNGEAWYGLVRAQLGLHHSRQAYLAAEEAMKSAPQSAGALTAAGLAMFRKGDLSRAEADLRSALKVEANYAGALGGLASIYSALSLAKSARDFRLAAYKRSPEDPELIMAYANTLKGEAHVKALEQAFQIYDPASEESRRLAVHIANDTAIGDRKLRRLAVLTRQPQSSCFRSWMGRIGNVASA